MICLNNTDTLEGGASVDAKIDYTVHGLVSGAFTKIASGQLSSTNPSVIYTASSAVAIVGITLVNTHTSAVTADLYIDNTNAGTPRRIIPKAISIQPGYQLVFDGQRIMMIDTAGGIVSGANVSNTAYAASWDSVTDVAPSKNAVYDKIETLVSGSYATSAEVKTGTEAAKVVAPSTLIGHEGVCKAWINFNGSGTAAINDSYNVSGITDNGTGDYTVTWDVDFGSVNYGVTGMITGAWGVSSCGSVSIKESSALVPIIAVGSVRVLCTDDIGGSALDPSICSLIAIGDR